MKDKLNENNQLYNNIVSIINLALKQVATTANLAMVHTYFEIGRMIVEDEQEGETRAEYGKKVLQELSIKLNKNFGRGFSNQNLRNMRQFYLVYSNRISVNPLRKLEDKTESIRQTASSEFQIADNQNKAIRQTPSAEFKNFTLSWSHYLVLMRIENPGERSFYEIEACPKMQIFMHRNTAYICLKSNCYSKN